MDNPSPEIEKLQKSRQLPETASLRAMEINRLLKDTTVKTGESSSLGQVLFPPKGPSMEAYPGEKPHRLRQTDLKKRQKDKRLVKHRLLRSRKEEKSFMAPRIHRDDLPYQESRLHRPAVSTGLPSSHPATLSVLEGKTGVILEPCYMVAEVESILTELKEHFKVEIPGQSFPDDDEQPFVQLACEILDGSIRNGLATTHFWNIRLNSALKCLKRNKKAIRILLISWFDTIIITDVEPGMIISFQSRPSREMDKALHPGTKSRPTKVTKNEIVIDYGSEAFSESDQLTIYDSIVQPVASEYKPDIVFLYGSPFYPGYFVDGFANLVKRAKQLAFGKLIVCLDLLESKPGYIRNICATLLHDAVNQDSSIGIETEPSQPALKIIERTTRMYGELWPCLKTSLNRNASENQAGQEKPGQAESSGSGEQDKCEDKTVPLARFGKIETEGPSTSYVEKVPNAPGMADIGKFAPAAVFTGKMQFGSKQQMSPARNVNSFGEKKGSLKHGHRGQDRKVDEIVPKVPQAKVGVSIGSPSLGDVMNSLFLSEFGQHLAFIKPKKWFDPDEDSVSELAVKILHGVLQSGLACTSPGGLVLDRTIRLLKRENPASKILVINWFGGLATDHMKTDPGLLLSFEKLIFLDEKKVCSQHRVFINPAFWLSSIDDQLLLFTSIVLPIAAEFVPDIVLFCSDALHFGSAESFGHLVRLSKSLAFGKLLVCLHNMENEPKVMKLVCEALLKERTENPVPDIDPSPAVLELIDEAALKLSEFWPCLNTTQTDPNKSAVEEEGPWQPEPSCSTITEHTPTEQEMDEEVFQTFHGKSKFFDLENLDQLTNMSVEKEIGPEGGTVELWSYEINFPANALAKATKTRFRISFVTKKLGLPSSCIPIGHPIFCHADGSVFNEDVSLTIPVWFKISDTSPNAAPVYINLLTRRKTGEWEVMDTVPLGTSETLTFKCKHFCPILPCVELGDADRGEFTLDYFLCMGESDNFASCHCVSSLVLVETLEKRMEKCGYRVVHPAVTRLSVKPNIRIPVSLTSKEPNLYDFESNEENFLEIDDDFYRHGKSECFVYTLFYHGNPVLRRLRLLYKVGWKSLSLCCKVDRSEQLQAAIPLEHLRMNQPSAPVVIVNNNISETRAGICIRDNAVAEITHTSSGGPSDSVANLEGAAKTENVQKMTSTTVTKTVSNFAVSDNSHCTVNQNGCSNFVTSSSGQQSNGALNGNGTVANFVTTGNSQSTIKQNRCDNAASSAGNASKNGSAESEQNDDGFDELD